MEKELLYTPVLVAPTQEELRSLLGDRPYLGVQGAARLCARELSHPGAAWRYSDKRDAFDCLCFEGDKRLCSLAHAPEQAFPAGDALAGGTQAV